jgi:hypothetical protein
MWCTWSWCGWYWGCKDVEDVVWIKWKVDFGSSSLGKTLCRSFPCPLPQEAASCRVRIFRLSVSPRLVPWPRRHPSTSFHRPDIWRCKDDIGTIISRQWNDWLQRRFVHVCCFASACQAKLEYTGVVFAVHTMLVARPTSHRSNFPYNAHMYLQGTRAGI